MLELIHNDVFGHVFVPSISKSMYYSSFIDDFLRNRWMYFFQNKSKVFFQFKEFKVLVENQIEKKLKLSMTNNGGEFFKNEFKEFYKKCVILRKNVSP